MIRRVYLIARHEFVKTVFTRAFAFLIALPISLATIPLFIGGGIAGIAGVAQMFGSDEEEAPSVVILHVADASGQLDPPAAVSIDEFDIQIVPVPVKDARKMAAADDSEQAATFLLVVHPDAMTTEEDSFTLYFDQEEAEEKSQVRNIARDWIRDARFVHAGFDPQVVEDLRSVSGDIERLDIITRTEEVAFLAKKGLPFAVLLLMYMTATVGGNGLLTSTIEDRNTRMVEILLGSVSPQELMLGKLVGHLGASVMLAVFWGGPAIPFIIGSSILAFVGPIQVMYVFAFFVVATLTYATGMGAIGSAVNDVRQAQLLITPVALGTLAAMAPAVYVGVYPDTGLSVFFSLCPPFGVYAMAVRLTTESGAPHWQVWLSLLLSAGFAALLLAASGRIYRLGLLLRGSPPNLRTLLRWMFTP